MATPAFPLAECPIRRDGNGRVVNAMSVDVEDYYHAHVLANHFTRDTWSKLERRVEGKTNEILDLFARHAVKGTFFTLGTVAREFPNLIRRITDEGHELASHGLEHYKASDQDRAAFLRDVSEARDALEQAGGVRVHGYRAASFSIGADNWWAFDVLEQAGYTYSSSVSAGKFNGADMQTPGTPFLPTAGRLVECPITTVPMLGRNVPTGGGYFRLVPYALFRNAMRRSQETAAHPANFYFHPWEIDPGQPKADVPLKSQLRHRVNLGRMKAKVARALSDFSWGTMQDAFGPALAPSNRDQVFQ